MKTLEVTEARALEEPQSTSPVYPPLACRGVSFRYHSSLPWIISEFTFDFKQGITLLKRASGCGKSTLLRLMAGYLTATSGDIVVPSGGSPHQLEYQRQHLGF